MTFPIQQGTLTVGTIVVPLMVQPQGRNTTIKIRNTHATANLYIGNPEVSSNGNNVGYVIPANTSDSITYSAQTPLFMISDTEGVTISYLITTNN